MDINQAFKFTYKLLLGECNVEMDEVKDWLLSYRFRLGKNILSIRKTSYGLQFELS